MSVTGAQWAELTDALKAQTEATTTALTTQAKAQRRLESLRVAGQSLGTCDGTDAAALREWLRILDLHHKKVGADDFTLALCKENARGGLQAALFTNTTDITWETLKASIVRNFLHTAEDLHYLATLANVKQDMHETEAAYISRFRTHTERAYATGVTPGAEMVRVQTLFLRGLRDNALSRRTFHKTENKTLDETMEVAQTLANENYRFSTLVPPSREYKAGAATVSAPTSAQPATRNAEMEALTLAVKRLTTEVGKLKAKDSPHGGTKKKATAYKSSKVPQPKLTKRTTPGRYPTGECFRCGRSGHRKVDCHAKYHINRTPICAECGQVGHRTIDCGGNDRKKRKTTAAAATNQSQNNSLNW